MPQEKVYPLDSETLELFARKGIQDSRSALPEFNDNGLKVRRVMQITSDFSIIPFDKLRIFDFACGEGVYAIEAALHGAEVIALDARGERMKEGSKAAERLNLKNLRFEQIDIRKVNAGSHGMADVIFFLGILYHLDYQDVLSVLKNIYEMCRQFVIIDTHISLHGHQTARFNEKTYYGRQIREHDHKDTEVIRRSRLQASIDNPWSFWFTKESLFRLLNDVGFTCVCECHVPFEAFKPEDRITVVAFKGKPVAISSYPWVNDRNEDEIKDIVRNSIEASYLYLDSSGARIKRLMKKILNGVLHGLGLEIKRI